MQPKQRGPKARVRSPGATTAIMRVGPKRIEPAPEPPPFVPPPPVLIAPPTLVGVPLQPALVQTIEVAAPKPSLRSRVARAAAWVALGAAAVEALNLLGVL